MKSFPTGRPRAYVWVFGAALLLLIGTGAAQCKAESHGFGNGWYYQVAQIIGSPVGPPPGDKIHKLAASTQGDEVCIPGSDDQDWSVGYTFWPATDKNVVPVDVAGSGGYATGLLDCYCFHSIEWRWEWNWIDNGVEDTRGGIRIHILQELFDECIPG